jgi:hypothetical protein
MTRHWQDTAPVYPLSLSQPAKGRPGFLGPTDGGHPKFHKRIRLRRSAARMLRSPTASAGRSLTDYPLTVRQRNGTLTHVLCSAPVYRDFNGEVLGELAVARDMTKPQEAFEATQGRPPPREPKDPVRTLADMAPCRGEHLNHLNRGGPQRAVVL